MQSVKPVETVKSRNGTLGEIIAVTSYDKYNSCKQCKVKVIDITSALGECSKCGMKIKLNRCGESIAAKLITEDKNGREYKVTMFNEIVQQVIATSAKTTLYPVYDIYCYIVSSVASVNKLLLSSFFFPRVTEKNLTRKLNSLKFDKEIKMGRSVDRLKWDRPYDLHRYPPNNFMCVSVPE